MDDTAADDVVVDDDHGTKEGPEEHPPCGSSPRDTEKYHIYIISIKI